MTASSLGPERYLNLYFVALPESVGIHHNVSLLFTYDERGTPYLRSPQINVEPSKLLLQGGSRDDVAIRFTHVATSAADSLVRLGAAVSVWAFATGDADAVEAVHPSDVFKSYADKFNGTKPVTVAEIAVFDHPVAADEIVEVELEDLSDPLLRALDCLQHLIRSYNLAADLPVAVPTYPRLGPKIPWARKRLLEPESEWEKFLSPLSHDNLSDRPAKLLEMKDLAQLMMNVQLLSAADLRTVYQETFLQAASLYEREGSYSDSIIKCAQACEVLFDGILGLLLWEEFGEAPSAHGPIDEAASTFSDDLRPRLRKAYHPLLGGRWHLDQDGPLADWSELIAEPRNRIVHRGYQPTSTEAASSLEATEALDSYITSLLARRAKRFPRTALMWVGDQGLKDAGAWPLVRAFAMKGRQAEPPWRDNYASWRQRVDSAITPRRRRR